MSTADPTFQGPALEMSVRRRIPREEDDAAVWLIDAPIMTNCGAAASSEMPGAFRPKAGHEAAVRVELRMISARGTRGPSSGRAVLLFRMDVSP